MKKVILLLMMIASVCYGVSQDVRVNGSGVVTWPTNLLDANDISTRARLNATSLVDRAYSYMLYTNSVTAMNASNAVQDVLIAGKVGTNDFVGYSNLVSQSFYPANNPSGYVSAAIGEPLWIAVSNQVVYSNDARLSDARTPLAHTQAWSTITNAPAFITGVATQGLVNIDVLGSAAFNSYGDFEPAGSVGGAVAGLTGRLAAVEGYTSTVATALQPAATNGWQVGSHADLYPRNNPSNYVSAADLGAASLASSNDWRGAGLATGSVVRGWIGAVGTAGSNATRIVSGAAAAASTNHTDALAAIALTNGADAVLASLSVVQPRGNTNTIILTGNPSPDVTGTYTNSGVYEGALRYSKGSVSVWYVNTEGGLWLVGSTFPADPYPNGWVCRSQQTTPDGTYSNLPSSSGTITATYGTNEYVTALQSDVSGLHGEQLIPGSVPATAIDPAAWQQATNQPAPFVLLALTNSVSLGSITNLNIGAGLAGSVSGGTLTITNAAAGSGTPATGGGTNPAVMRMVVEKICYRTATTNDVIGWYSGDGNLSGLAVDTATNYAIAEGFFNSMTTVVQTAYAYGQISLPYSTAGKTNASEQWYYSQAAATGQPVVVSIIDGQNGTTFTQVVATAGTWVKVNYPLVGWMTNSAAGSRWTIRYTAANTTTNVAQTLYQVRDASYGLYFE